MEPKPAYEYASPTAPWNRPARPRSAEARERLVRRHLDELLPPIEGSPGKYENRYKYYLHDLLGQVIHESAPEERGPLHRRSGPAYRMAEKITFLHPWTHPHFLPDEIGHYDRERIVQHLVRNSALPLYRFTVSERIRQCDEHQAVRTAKPKK